VFHEPNRDASWRRLHPPLAARTTDGPWSGKTRRGEMMRHIVVGTTVNAVFHIIRNGSRP
jgi:hypothetical protein